MKSIIYEAVKNYVKLTKQGKKYIGLCPFHNEKTPSFVVSPDSEFYHCYGCGAFGNAKDFLFHMEDKDIDPVEFAIENDFMKIYGSEEKDFDSETFGLMKIAFEAGWRISRQK